MKRTMGTCILVVAALAVSACTAVVGSGTAKEESRLVSDAFTKVGVSSALKATIKVGPAVSVEVSGDDNIVPLITTQVSGGVLQIGVEDSAALDPKLPMVVAVTMPALESVEASGASALCASPVSAEDFIAKASGASYVTVVGTATNLTADASGASHLFLGKLEAKTADLTASGASRIEADATSAALADASGASTIAIAGGGTITKNESGGSTVSAK